MRGGVKVTVSVRVRVRVRVRAGFMAPGVRVDMAYKMT